jgi:pimeloyl-ACP methyl ester carboxylesterase
LNNSRQHHMNYTHKGFKLAYQSRGDGPALVLIHGFTESSAIWEDFAGELSAGFRVITPDLPGHGRSDCIGEVHTMDAMAGAVKSLLDHLGVKACVMIGHSMGGYVTLSFARMYPEMLRGAGLFHSTALPDSPEAREGRSQAIEIIRSDRKGFLFKFIPGLFAPENRERLKEEINALVKAANSMTAQAIIAAQEGMKIRQDGRDVLFAASYPVMFIGGQKDNRIPFESIRELAGIPETSYSLFLKNSGHMGYLEARDETLGFVRFFAETASKFRD